MNKEQIYDEKINPLMAQIIDVCQKNGIAMLASFAIGTEEEPTLRCTTHLRDEAGKHEDDFARAAGMIRYFNPPLLHMRTVDADGNTTLTAIAG